jgi:hypothetical protein
MGNRIIYPTLKAYTKAKIKMLQRDFYMNLSDQEKEHMYALKTETAVDRYVHDLFFTKM